MRLALNLDSASFVSSPTPPAPAAKLRQLDPHLRYAPKLYNVSMLETRAGEELDDVMKGDTSEALL
jgi:hypothetical protein